MPNSHTASRRHHIVPHSLAIAFKSHHFAVESIFEKHAHAHELLKCSCPIGQHYLLSTFRVRTYFRRCSGRQSRPGPPDCACCSAAAIAAFSCASSAVALWGPSSQHSPGRMEARRARVSNIVHTRCRSTGRRNGRLVTMSHARTGRSTTHTRGNLCSHWNAENRLHAHVSTAH